VSFVDALREHRLIAIVRGTDEAAALAAVLTLAECGVRIVEVSLTTAGAASVIAQARARLGPDAHLGAGTIVDVAGAARAADAGASFVVTPGLGPGVAAAQARGLAVVAGALTPSEVIAATGLGVDAIKLFPASLGGVRYLRALRDPFPDVPFVPVGGVDVEAAGGYLAAGAVAVGVGSPLLGDAPAGGSLDLLRKRAAEFVAAVE
jgi:2-dehydro-3-deoxyphosphogluconate aldolase/(4S)-4-hydroxy-2-oxoglutarate aldolase